MENLGEKEGRASEPTRRPDDRCSAIRTALGNKRRYELRAIARTAGLERVSRLNRGELADALHEAYRTDPLVRDRLREQLDLTFWHRHRRPIAAISLVSSILGILGFFSFFLARDDSELLDKLEEITNKTLEEALGSHAREPEHPVVQLSPESEFRVDAVQHLLVRRGFYNGPIDGIFGPRTRAAISRFQSTAGLEAYGKP